MSPPIIRTLLVWLAIGQAITAQAAVFAKIPDIEGESTHAAYPSWIEADSLEFTGSIFQGAAGSFGIVKRTDRSSTFLIRALDRERFLPRVTIALLRPDPDNATAPPVEFARLLFRDVIVEKYQQSNALSPTGELEVVERFKLNFRAVFYRYTPDGSTPETVYTDLDVGLDSDNDGMTDKYENFFGLSNTTDDSMLDSDGDGLTHLEEFRLGLNPRQSSSAFVPKGDADPENPQNFRLSWQTKPAKNYDIYFTPSLDQAPTFIRRVTAEELDTSTSFPRNQARGFFSIREVIAR